MILTEEEAKTKHCVDHHQLCTASACMAWRWGSWRGPLDGTEQHVGYCGKAGAPTTPWSKP